jgi:hypothetical protein
MALVKDDDVVGDTVLWRRILPAWIIEENGRYRPQSIAFVDRHTEQLSVYVAHLTNETVVMQDYPDQSLIAFRAEIPLSEGCTVYKIPDDPNPAHRVLCNETQSAMRRVGKRISRDFTWVRRLPGSPQ